MTKKTPATPSDYLASAEPAKREDAAKLHALISKAVPRFDPAVSGSMLGYGRYHYRYASGREGTSFRVAFATNKTGFSIYVTAVDTDGNWLAELEKDRIGKASVGKSCIRFKRLSDIDTKVLAALLKRAAKSKAPGEVDAPEGEPARARKR